MPNISVNVVQKVHRILNRKNETVLPLFEEHLAFLKAINAHFESEIC